jgi:hypothetical protein
MTQVRERRISAPSPAQPEDLAQLRTMRSRSTLRDERAPSPPMVKQSPRKPPRPQTAMSVLDGENHERDAGAEYYGATTSSAPRRSATLGKKPRQPLPPAFVDQSYEDQVRIAQPR